MFGDPNTTPGGYAIKFHSSVRVQLYKSGQIKDKDGNTVGVGVRAQVVKNRISAPGRSTNFSVYFKKGVDNLESNFNYLVDKEVVRKPTTQSYELDFNGQTYKFRSTQWRENVLKIQGLEQYLDELTKQKCILNLDKPDVIVDEETGSVKLDESSEIE
jgi:recombination protein RecA